MKKIIILLLVLLMSACSAVKPAETLSSKQMEQTIVKAMEFYNKHLERQRNERDAR